jgi:integrase
MHIETSRAISQYIKTIYVNNQKTGVNYAGRLKNFETYFSKKYNFTIDDFLVNKTFKIDVYDLLADYVFYLTAEYVSPDGFHLSSITIKNTVNTVRNFLEYHDIDINPRKYKLRVRQPRVIRQHKDALTKEDITRILQTCVTPKLRLFVHFLAVSGCRAAEATAVRLIDIDTKNYKVHVRGEYAKNKVDRYTFVTKEFVEQLHEYLKYKYRRRVKYYETGKEPIIVIPKRKETDLLFASYFVDAENESQENQSPDFIYNNLLLKFEKTLDLLDIQYENSSTHRRRRITFHSLRRFTKSVISDLGYSDFSEWYIGHAGSTYYRRSDKDKFELFKKIEPYLTFLDAKGQEQRHADLQTRVDTMETENRELRENIHKIMEMIQQNPSLANVKPEVLTKKVAQ